MRKKIAILLSIALVLPMVLIAMPASADYSTYTDRLSGATRVETAVEISKVRVPATGGANSVVLARKDNYPDALAGGVLACAKDTSVLLTDGSTLDTAAKGEINRVLNNVTGTVYILGGTGAISTAVENAVKVLDADYTVTRLSGTDRYGTAAAIANAVNPNPTHYLIATGENFPDALAAAAAGGYKGYPVLLVKKDSIPSGTRNVLLGNRDANLIVIGGTGVISDAILAELATLVTGSIKRVSGADRYATSVEVAKYSDLWAKATTPGSATTEWAMARGDDFADALAGACLADDAADFKCPLLLTQSSVLNTTTENYLKGIYPSTGTVLSKVYVLGGTGAIADSVERAVATRVSCEKWGVTLTAPTITSVAGATVSPVGPGSDTQPDVVMTHVATATANYYTLTLYDATGATPVKLAILAANTSPATTSTIANFDVAPLSTNGSRVLKVTLTDTYGNESAMSAGFTYVLDTIDPYPTSIVLSNGAGTLTKMDTGDKITITFSEAATNVPVSDIFTNGSLSGIGSFSTGGTNSGTYTTALSADNKTVTITLTVTATAITLAPSGTFTFVAGIIDLVGNGVVTTSTYPTSGTW